MRPVLEEGKAVGQIAGDLGEWLGACGIAKVE